MKAHSLTFLDSDLWTESLTEARSRNNYTWPLHVAWGSPKYDCSILRERRGKRKMEERESRGGERERQTERETKRAHILLPSFRDLAAILLVQSRH